MMRQAEQKQRQAINKRNQEIRRQNQKAKSVIDKYNREVRAYNSHVKRERQRILDALRKLSRTPVKQSFQVYHRTTISLNTSYEALALQDLDETDPHYGLVVEQASRENANSLALANTLYTGEAEDAAFDDEQDDDEVVEEPGLHETSITTELRIISTDLDSRWRGALFALSPANPDAARHFCTSAREIFTQILHIRAPDAAVLAVTPGAELDSRGAPTRRSRIHYLVRRKHMSDAFEEFTVKNIDNVLALFDVFNQGTHAEAGRFKLAELAAVKRRCEDAILFLLGLAAQG